ADLAEVARRAAAEQGGEAVVRVRAPPDLPPGRVSPAALGAVLATLLENSEQAGARAVDLRVSTDGERLRLVAADDGAGVPEADRARVFEPFFTGRRERGGTGLGLPIARSLLAATGGALALDEAVGRGATFVLTVPRVDR
ncbi:MAG: hypothetical protein AVDCRST_MAG40-467, partial [uncultured Gemmatimonadaceae bacterium]